MSTFIDTRSSPLPLSAYPHPIFLSSPAHCLFLVVSDADFLSMANLSSLVAQRQPTLSVEEVLDQRGAALDKEAEARRDAKAKADAALKMRARSPTRHEPPQQAVEDSHRDWPCRRGRRQERTRRPRSPRHRRSLSRSQSRQRHHRSRSRSPPPPSHRLPPTPDFGGARAHWLSWNPHPVSAAQPPPPVLPTPPANLIVPPPAPVDPHQPSATTRLLVALLSEKCALPLVADLQKLSTGMSGRSMPNLNQRVANFERYIAKTRLDWEA